MSGADGRAGQEAARLLAAAQEWLRTSAPHLAPVGEDGEPCSCPLCRAVVGLRDADPETVGRWVDAAVAGASSALAQAATVATDAARPTPDASADSAAGATDETDDTAPATPETSTEDDVADRAVGHDGGRSRVRRIRLDGDVGPDLP